MRTRWIASLSLAAAMACGGLAQPPASRLVERVYPIADLLIPIDATHAVLKLASAARPGCPEVCTPDTTRAQPAKAVTSSFAVGTAINMVPVHPAHVAALTRLHGKPVHAGHVMQVIQNTVAPATWECRGGSGVIGFHHGALALVVHQSPEVQDQVRSLLEHMRRSQEVEYFVETRFITTVPSALKGCDCCQEIGAQLCFLSPAEVAKFMAEVQKNPRTLIRQAPKISNFSGRETTIRICESLDRTVGVDATHANGRTILTPKTEKVEVGLTANILGNVSADGGFVTLRMSFQKMDLRGELHGYPERLTEVQLANGSKAKIMIPIRNLDIQSQESTLTIPSGGSMLFSLGFDPIRAWDAANEAGCTGNCCPCCVPGCCACCAARECTCRTCCECRGEADACCFGGPEFLARMPYLNRLLKNRVPRNDEVHLVLVTAWCAKSAEGGEEAADAVRPEPIARKPRRELSPDVMALVQKYHAAFAAGRVVEAERLARQALALDPCCFADPQ
jgi:hypothetical protein